MRTVPGGGLLVSSLHGRSLVIAPMDSGPSTGGGAISVDHAGPRMESNRLGYVSALDGLRGVAIALVVSHHFFGRPFGGSLGVDLFFCLSGFLITTLLLEERAATGDVSLRGFYVRRARRLFPALATLLVFYLVADAARGENGVRMVAEAGLYAGNLIQAFSNPNPLLHHGLDHLWSLAEEEQFYAVWPLMLMLIVRNRRLVLTVGLLLAALVAYRIGLVLSGASRQRLYMGPDLHAEGLMAGALLAVIRFRRPAFAVSEGVAQFSLAVFLLAAFFMQPLSPSWNYGLPLVELAAVGLVAASVSATALAEALSWRPLVWLGAISYSLYLWPPVVEWLFGGGYRGVTLPLGVVLAWASYRFIEQPFRRSRRRIERAVRASPAAI
jgi:peptidoglycan/LPS O-acetylase OafA/YrhL